jgi:hypothetical protein
MDQRPLAEPPSRRREVHENRRRFGRRHLDLHCAVHDHPESPGRIAGVIDRLAFIELAQLQPCEHVRAEFRWRERDPAALGEKGSGVRGVDHAAIAQPWAIASNPQCYKKLKGAAAGGSPD